MPPATPRWSGQSVLPRPAAFSHAGMIARICRNSARFISSEARCGLQIQAQSCYAAEGQWKMKSTGRAARSRSAYCLDLLRDLVSALIIYLGPLMVGASPLLLLYWLYRPTVLMNPGLAALKAAPTTVVSFLPPSRWPFGDDVETSSQAAVVEVAEAVDEPEPAAEKPKSSSGTRDRHQVVGHASRRFAGGAVRPASAHTISAAVNSLGQYTGMSRNPSSAYARAVNQTRQWW